MSTSIECLERDMREARERLRRAEEYQSEIEELQAANRRLLLLASELEAEMEFLSRDQTQ